MYSKLNAHRIRYNLDFALTFLCLLNFIQVNLAAVNVIPLFLNTAPDLIIDDTELDVSFIPSSKQKRRVIESAVCIQHIPTGLKVQSSG